MDNAIETPELYMDDIGADMETIEMYTGDDAMGATVTSGDATDVAIVSGITLIWTVFMFSLFVVMIVAMWKIFTKAGEAGWKSLIPLYREWVMLEIAGKPGWWLIWFFIPIVNLFVVIIMYHALSKAFGKGMGYTLGLIFLSPVFFVMLAFGDATYTKPRENTGSLTDMSQ